MQILVVPKWHFVSNIGDTVMSTFLPRVIKHLHPNDELGVVTSHEALSLFKDIKEVDNLYLPDEKMIGHRPEDWANPTIKYSIFPLDDPKVFSLWNSRFDDFHHHPTLNKISLNYLCQNELEHLVDTDIDFRPEVKPLVPANPIELHGSPLIGIVPADKQSGRSEPHPGCTGKGYRFNGDNGESWRELIKQLKNTYPNCQIIEFTKGQPIFGDASTNVGTIKELAWYASKMDIGIMSDGGLHHIFNSQRTTVVLIQYKIARSEFFSLHNSAEVNNDKCIKTCTPLIKNMTKFSDVTSFCQGWCEQIPIESVTNKVKEILC